MNRNSDIERFSRGLMAAGIKSTFMLQVSLEESNSYRVEKESLLLNVGAEYTLL